MSPAPRTGVLAGICAATTVVAMTGAAPAQAAPAAPAAAGECRVVPRPQERINSIVHSADLAFTGCQAADTKYALWDVAHPNGDVYDRVAWSPTSGSGWDIVGSSQPGRIIFRPVVAYDSQDREISQNTAVVDLRYDSRASLGLKRSGGTLTFTANARRYSSATNAYVAWANMPGVIQYRSGNQWIGFRTVKTTSAGYATLTLPISRTYDYRVVFPDLGSTWGAASPSARG